MGDKHIFNKETDSERLAMDIVAFLRKWGMWQDVQIFTGGKCYTDDNGELRIRNEAHPENYTNGLSDLDCNGESIWKDFSNPERLLDMTFEGPLSLLLRHHEYEVKIGDVSDEVKRIIVPETDECMDAVLELVDEYFEGQYSWDPVEYDSYEEWLELNQYCDMDEFLVEEKIIDGKEKEFSSREEYDDFLMRTVCEREAKVYEYFEDDICANTDEYLYNDTFYDSGKIANRVLNEFADLLEKYGLWYELCFSWSLTTYRIE
jgi:hypothetical protein